MVCVRELCYCHSLLAGRSVAAGYAVFCCPLLLRRFTLCNNRKPLKTNVGERSYFEILKSKNSFTGISSARAKAYTVLIVVLITPLSILESWLYSISASFASPRMDIPFPSLNVLSRWPKDIQYA